MLRGMQKFKMSTGLKAHTGFEAYLSPTLNFASDWGPVSFREAPQHVCSSKGSYPPLLSGHQIPYISHHLQDL